MANVSRNFWNISNFTPVFMPSYCFNQPCSTELTKVIPDVVIPENDVEATMPVATAVEIVFDANLLICAQNGDQQVAGVSILVEPDLLRIKILEIDGAVAAIVTDLVNAVALLDDEDVVAPAASA